MILAVAEKAVFSNCDRLVVLGDKVCHFRKYRGRYWYVRGLKKGESLCKILCCVC